MNRMKTCSLMIPGCIGSVGAAVEKIMQFTNEQWGSLDESSYFEIKVVLNELIVNAIKHGSKLDAKKCIHIVAGISSKDEFFLFVKDEGAGFDCKCTSAKTPVIQLPDDIIDVKEDGRGIFIVRHLCDRIRYNKKGNKVLVVKKLNRD